MLALRRQLLKTLSVKTLKSYLHSPLLQQYSYKPHESRSTQLSPVYLVLSVWHPAAAAEHQVLQSLTQAHHPVCKATHDSLTVIYTMQQNAETPRNVLNDKQQRFCMDSHMLFSSDP